MTTLRPYQQESCDAIRRELQEHRSTLLVLPTGTGKSTVFGDIVAGWPGRCLVLAHRTELVQQARDRIEQMTGEFCDVEQAGRSSYSARIVVGSMASVTQKGRLHRLGRDAFGLLVIDECFPAGTMVSTPAGEIPIETVRKGDVVCAVDHRTGLHEEKTVTRTMSHQHFDGLVTIRLRHGTVRCTVDHPIFVEGKGYVGAGKIAEGDVLYVRKAVRVRRAASVWATRKGSQEEVRKARLQERCSSALKLLRVWKRVLLSRLQQVRQASAPPENLFDVVPLEALRGDFGGHEPPGRSEADAGEQPDARSIRQGSNGGYFASDWAPPAPPRWKRVWIDDTAGHSLGSARDGVGGRVRRGSRPGAGQRLADSLQAGPGEPGAEGMHRGRRVEPLRSFSSEGGCEEGWVLARERVVSVSREQPAGTGCRVYNLEVEDCHTYFANGVLVHNCHRARNASYERIMEWFASAKVLGVTATPDRGDNKALGEGFETVAYQMDILDAIDGGWLVPVEAQRIKVEEVDLSVVKATAGDLQVGQLDREMLKACASVAAKTCELVGPDAGQGVVFFPGIESGMLAAEWFNRYRPGSARFICGQTPPEERAELFRDYARGKFQWLVNVMIATEGWDHPPARWCVVARPTKSRGLYAQMAGRCTRPLPGVVDGPETSEERRAAIAASAKPNCTILDFYGNTGRHDLCTPVDVLGGRFTDQEREEAKKAEAAGVKPKDVVDTLQGARDKLRRVAAEHEARIKASVERVNAFKRSGQDVGAAGYREGRVVNGATDKQLALLAKMGVNHVPTITKTQASNLIDKHMKVRSATPAQMRALSFHVGALPPKLRFTDAGRALNYINGCREKGIPIRRDRVARLIAPLERAR